LREAAGHNPRMSVPRSARSLARLVLAWFVVSLAVASAAPVLRPAAAMERLCSAGGEVRWINIADTVRDADASTAGHHTLDCPLCLSATPPSPPVRWETGRNAVAQYVAQPTAADPSVAPTRAPFPPRAPPRVG